MRKNVVLSLISVTLLFVILVTGTYLEKHYTCGARVYDVEDDGCIIFEDKRGELWAYESLEHYDLGTHVKIKFDTNGTANYIYDDTIVGVERR